MDDLEEKRELERKERRKNAIFWLTMIIWFSGAALLVWCLDFLMPNAGEGVLIFVVPYFFALGVMCLSCSGLPKLSHV